MDYFSEFGNVESIKLIMDKKSGISKGYGFLVCGDIQSYHRILGAKNHVLSGRKIECNVACNKDDAPKSIKDIRRRKIFISGIRTSTTQGKFKVS